MAIIVNSYILYIIIFCDEECFLYIFNNHLNIYKKKNLFSLKRILRTNGPKIHIIFKEDNRLYIKEYTTEIYHIDVKLIKLSIVNSLLLYGMV